MTEEQNKQALPVQNEINNLSDKNINSEQEKNKELETITIQVQKKSNEIPNTDDRINGNIQETLPNQIDLNEKDIYQLPSESLEKLSLQPCPVCQSMQFSVFIPETYQNSKPENPQQQTTNNVELQTIKTQQRQTYSLPVLICEQKHKYCLLCNQDIHPGLDCNIEYMIKNNFIRKLYIIKEVVPEEKKIVLDSILSIYVKTEEETGCCSCACFWYTTLFLFLLLLMTAASVFLFAFGLGLLFVAYGLRLVCCLYHCFVYTFCTSSVTEEDKGDYILRTTTVDVGKQDQIVSDLADNDDCLSQCGAMALAYSIL